MASAKQFFLAAAAFWMFVCCCMGILIYYDGDQRESASFVFMEWARPSCWKSVDCNVISAGINCVERDTGDICAGFSNSRAPEGRPSVFTSTQLASCPGSFWCSKEGDVCECTGQVTFYSQLMDLTEFKGVHDAVRKQVKGSIQCDVTTFGTDPQPGVYKHCWCTPDPIVQSLDGGLDATMNHVAQCAKDHNNELKNGISRQARRLSYDNRTHSTAAKHEEDDYIYDTDEDDSPAEQDTLVGRRLTSFYGGSRRSDSRRRRTMVYTPWAYVEVKPARRSIFERHGKEPESKKVCAFQWGAPQADFEVQSFTRDGRYSYYGAYGSRGADTFVHDWAAEGGRLGQKCLMRTCSTDACPAVAMRDLDSFLKSVKGQGNFLHILGIILMFCGVCCGGACFCGALHAPDSAFGREADLAESLVASS